MENEQFTKAKQNYINLRADLAQSAILLKAGSLKSPKEAYNEEARNAQSSINDLMNSCEKGFELLIQNLTPEEQAAFFSALEPLKSITPEKIKNLMDTHLFVHQALGISDAVVNTLYQLGKKLLSEQAFEEAGHVFIILTILCPQSLEVWLGLGKAHQECKKYDEALIFYERALELNPQSSLAQSYKNDCASRLL